MAIIKPEKHVFKAFKSFKEVRHYQSVKELKNGNIITSKINISKDRKFNNSKGILYWLKFRLPTKWSKEITGLKVTKKPLLFYGDIPTTKNGIYKPTHLLIFRFNAGGTILKIDLYKDSYPKNDIELQKILLKS